MIAERALVVVYLVNPREKYWGRLETLNVAGVYVRGLDLGIVDEWAREIARGDTPSLGPSEMFFPLTRVEKMFLDESIGVAGSVRESFRRIVGREVEEFL